MKKTLLGIIVICALMCRLFITVAYSANGEGWYIIKRNGCAPGFPKSAEFLSEHSCYFIDKSASESGEKVLYLTFDAGYENGNVEKILDILKSENITAAFFILSNLINKNTSLVERMFDEGHLVCNHTTNHKCAAKMSAEEMSDNLLQLERLCYEKTGREMAKYFRYPEGYYTTDAVINLESLGYKTFFWSMSHADWDNGRQPDPKRATEQLLSNTHPGAIILLHPTADTNVRILPSLIQHWREAGYRFGSLDEIVCSTN